MVRLFYRIEDKTYLDKTALVQMAQENLIGLDEINEIFGISTNNLIEV